MLTRCSLLLVVVLSLRTVASHAQSAPSEPTQSNVIIFNRLDELALGFLRNSGKTQNAKRFGVTRQGIELYILPSGRLAFPLRNALSERDVIGFTLVHPRTAKEVLQVTHCGAAVFDRVQGSPDTNKPKAADSSGQALLSALDAVSKNVPTVAMMLEPLSNTYSCSDSLQMTATTKLDFGATSPLTGIADTTTSVLHMDPVFLFTYGGGFGFDGGHPTRISVQDRPVVAASSASPPPANPTVSTEKYLLSENDRVGPGTAVMLGIRICGMDPRRATSMFGPLDESWSLATPFQSLLCTALSPQFVIPTSRDRGQFAMAFPVISAYGVDFLAGISLAPNDELRPGSNSSIADPTKILQSGNTYIFSGDPPVKSVWFRKKGRGFYASLGTSVAAVSDWFSHLSTSNAPVTTKQTNTQVP